VSSEQHPEFRPLLIACDYAQLALWQYATDLTAETVENLQLV